MEPIVTQLEKEGLITVRAPAKKDADVIPITAKYE